MQSGWNSTTPCSVVLLARATVWPLGPKPLQLCCSRTVSCRVWPAGSSRNPLSCTQHSHRRPNATAGCPSWTSQDRLPLVVHWQQSRHALRRLPKSSTPDTMTLHSVPIPGRFRVATQAEAQVATVENMWGRASHREADRVFCCNSVFHSFRPLSVCCESSSSRSRTRQLAATPTRASASTELLAEQGRTF